MFRGGQMTVKTSQKCPCAHLGQQSKQAVDWFDLYSNFQLKCLNSRRVLMWKMDLSRNLLQICNTFHVFWNENDSMSDRIISLDVVIPSPNFTSSKYLDYNSVILYLDNYQSGTLPLAGTSKAQVLDKGIRQKSTKRVNSFIACSAFGSGTPNRDSRGSEKWWCVYTSIAMMAWHATRVVACLQVFGKTPTKWKACIDAHRSAIPTKICGFIRHPMRTG